MYFKTQVRITFLITMLLMSGLVRASLIHDLSISELFNFTGSGQISFSSYSGNSLSGVDDFNFSGTGTQGSFAFSKSDIANIDWLVDTTTSSLTLHLETFSVTSAPGIQTCMILFNNGAGGSCPILTTTSTFSRIAQQTTGLTTTGGGYLTTTAVPSSIPEPASSGLLIMGILFTGFSRFQFGKS